MDINIYKYEICTVLKTFPEKKKSDYKPTKNFKDTWEKLDDFTEYFEQNLVLKLLCLKDKRVGFSCYPNIRIYNKNFQKIDIIIPIKSSYIFQYLKDGNLIACKGNNILIIFSINKNKYNIIQNFDMKKNFIPKKILELSNNQIISIDVSPYIEFYSKTDGLYSSLKILYLKYDRVEDAKDIIEIPGNKLVVFSYKFHSLLVFDINSNECLLKKPISYSIYNIMSDLIDNRYIFAGSDDGIVVYDINNDFSQILYQDIKTPYYLNKINAYEYFFVEENLIQLVKFKDKKFEKIKTINFRLNNNCSYDSKVYKIDDFKFIIKIGEKKINSQYFIIFNKV